MSKHPSLEVYLRVASAALVLLSLAGCGDDDVTPTFDGGGEDAAVVDAGEGCAEDEQVSANACVACPAGSTNAAGDDPQGADTTCDATLCDENERVSANACGMCPPGTMNMAGDDATGADTMCDGTLCPSNERVEGNACVACPPGSTNEAGDDATGADTMCDATICGEDEFVQDNTCVACPAGIPNEAGDDATGEDTVCDDACSEVFGVLCEDFDDGYLKASNAEAGDFLGANVAIDGDTLAVAATHESSNATGVDGEEGNNDALEGGAVYIFTRSDGVWSQQAYLKASNTGEDDEFGSAIALSGDTVAIGAFQEDSDATGIDGDGSSNDAGESGAVYVFTRSGSTWSHQAYIKASNTDAGDQFGAAVALDGDTLAVGARWEGSDATGIGGDETNNDAEFGGAVYVFARSGDTWSQQEYIKASNTERGDGFGFSVALEGDTLAVGARSESSIDGDESNNDAPNSGAVYVFTRDGDAWSQQAYLKASNAGPSDAFGYSVALSGDTLAVGAQSEFSGATGIDGDGSNNDLTFSGAAYVFVRSGERWSQQAYIKASNTDRNDLFGNSIALSGDVLAVGAVFEDGNATGFNGDGSNNDTDAGGAVYVFTRSAGVWSQLAYLKASNTGEGDRFGSSVALSDGSLVVGASGESSAATGVGGDESNNDAERSGAVYVRRVAR